MRSFIVTAAMAALFGSSPLATAYAAPHPAFAVSHGSFGSPSHFSERGDHYRGGPYDDFYGDDYLGWGPFYDSYYHPGWYPTPSTYVASSRLSVALSDLQVANHRIATASARRLLSPAEARSLRSRDAAIRREALNNAARNGDRLTAPAYRVIRRQIGDLDRTIARDSGLA